MASAGDRRLSLVRASRWFGWAAVVVLLAGCGTLFLPEAATEQGGEVRGLYGLVLGLAALVFVGVEGFIVYAIIRYRRRSGDDTLPAQHHGNNLVEVMWTAIPAVIVVVLFVLSTQTLASIQTRAPQPLTVEVEAFQWQWTFRYPNGYATTGTLEKPAEMVLPVGRPVRLVMWSRDVIHSFYVPAFLVKRDTLPQMEGRAANELEFTIREPGVYSGQCAEFCGLYHSKMTLTVRALPAAEWEAWAAEVGEP